MSRRPIINGKYSCTAPQLPSTICHAIHTRMEMAKMMPPPRSTIVVCELRWLGLSMMLHLSAILKYNSSVANSSTTMIKYAYHIYFLFLFLLPMTSLSNQPSHSSISFSLVIMEYVWCLSLTTSIFDDQNHQFCYIDRTGS